MNSEDEQVKGAVAAAWVRTSTSVTPVKAIWLSVKVPAIPTAGSTASDQKHLNSGRKEGPSRAAEKGQEECEAQNSRGA